MENESNKTAIDQMFDIIEGLAEYSPENPLLQSLLTAKPRLKELEKEQMISFAYTQIQYIDAEIGDLIYKKLPQEIYNETYGGKNGR
jgi:hypothetical protein